MNLGPGELLIILVIVLIVFGAGRLPQVFSSLGKGVKEFRDAAEGQGDNAPPSSATSSTTATTGAVTTTAPTTQPPVSVAPATEPGDTTTKTV